jgi:PadR family transcriptional regulator AphA
MSLTHALLGLLAVRPSSGYELTKSFEGDLGRYAWQAGHTSIYPELNRLAERGLVEVRAELREWLLAPPRAGRVRNEQVLRMFLISALDPKDALILLRGIAERTREGADELRRIRVENDDVPFTSPEGFGLLAAEFGVRQYDAVHSWAVWAIERLEKELARAQT